MTKQHIILQEYQTLFLDFDEITETEAFIIWKFYKKYISIEFPSPKTENRWELKAKNWIGFIPVSHRLILEIEPKISLLNLFWLIEYVHFFKVDFFPALFQCDSIKGFYSFLVTILVEKVFLRCQKGLYMAYIPKTEQLSYVRGRCELKKVLPYNTKLPCSYTESTMDIKENQVITWTLFQIIKSNYCKIEMKKVKEAYRKMKRFTILKAFFPFSPGEYQYNRLNFDYKIIHALCSFFLKGTIPLSQMGQIKMLPFVFHMASLYEIFVATWLQRNISNAYSVAFQERYYFENDRRYFRLDIVIYDKKTSLPCFILDTKYKFHTMAEMTDVAQMIAYATAKQCRYAILVYPVKLKKPLCQNIGDIHLRSLEFSLSEDIERAGKNFLRSLFGVKYEK